MRAYCGFSKEKITPEPSKVFLDGYGFRLDAAKGVRDDLFVKVCAFKDDTNKCFAIVSFDICGFNEEISKILKYHISFINNIDENNYAICAIHTHAGPSCGLLADLPINYDYWHHVGELAGNCVKKAFENIEVGNLSFRFSDDMVSTFNRRGSDINDKRVRVGSFFDLDNSLKGVLAKATCHPVIQTEDYISADFLSVLNRGSSDVPIVFMQGSCGDIDPHFDGNLSSNEKIEKLGKELFDSVINSTKQSFKHLQKVDKENKFNINYISELLNIPMSPFVDKDVLIEKLNSLTVAYYDMESQFEKHYILRELNWYRMALDKVLNNELNNIIVPIQVLILSDNLEKSVFVFLPFENFCITSKVIEEKLNTFGFLSENIFINSYSNMVCGYLVPKSDFLLGGYEVSSAPIWYNMPLYSEDSEDTVIECIVRLVKHLI